MNLDQYLNSRRTLRNIKRFNMETVIQPQNLCEHGYGVTTLFYLLCKDLKIALSSKDLFLIMQHDFLESLTGDLNKKIKDKSSATKMAWEVIEYECGEDLQEYSDKSIQKQLQDDDRKYQVFLLADAMDAMLYCQDEVRLGNSHLKNAFIYYKNKVEDIVLGNNFKFSANLIYHKK
jgi:5'-deoxynucleotidase YfbR-like HD superfamily hydrolase